MHPLFLLLIVSDRSQRLSRRSQEKAKRETLSKVNTSSGSRSASSASSRSTETSLKLTPLSLPLLLSTEYVSPAAVTGSKSYPIRP